MSTTCPKCGHSLRFLAGAPAHENNLYCEHCSYEAWNAGAESQQKANSTEAMRKAFNAGYPHRYLSEPDPWDDEFLLPAKKGFIRGWQAATANQEALIRAVIEECAKACEELNTYEEDDPMGSCAEAIRQITPQQVMEKMK